MAGRGLATKQDSSLAWPRLPPSPAPLFYCPMWKSDVSVIDRPVKHELGELDRDMIDWGATCWMLPEPTNQQNIAVSICGSIWCTGEGLLTADVRDPNQDYAQGLTYRTTRKGTQKNLIPSGSIWHIIPVQIEEIRLVSNILILGLSYLYVKFCVLPLMCVSWCILGWLSAERLYKMSLLIEWMRRSLTIFEARPSS